MARHTIIALAGKRLEIKPSPTSPGHVLVQILSADRQVQASLTLDPHASNVAGEGLRSEAVLADHDARRLNVEIAREEPATVPTCRVHVPAFAAARRA